MDRDNRWLETLFPSNAGRSIAWPDVGETVVLYRPVGEHELALIAQSSFRAFPPRLADQPIFYPVLNFRYAEEIAHDWNARRDHPPVGYVTKFEVDARIATKYDIQSVGQEKLHQELCGFPPRNWKPSTRPFERLSKWWHTTPETAIRA